MKPSTPSRIPLSGLPSSFLPLLPFSQLLRPPRLPLLLQRPGPPSSGRRNNPPPRCRRPFPGLSADPQKSDHGIPAPQKLPLPSVLPAIPPPTIHRADSLPSSDLLQTDPGYRCSLVPYYLCFQRCLFLRYSFSSAFVLYYCSGTRYSFSSP